MISTNNDNTGKLKVENFLKAQRDLYDFIQSHSEFCVEVNPENESNCTHIGKCGHRYPDYYRIADISLFGERYQICGCVKCNGKISFIHYPNGWLSSEELPGVPIDLALKDIPTYISTTIDTLDFDVDDSPGIFKDSTQYAMMLEREIKSK
jgi:hypothetical protein